MIEFSQYWGKLGFYRESSEENRGHSGCTELIHTSQSASVVHTVTVIIIIAPHSITLMKTFGLLSVTVCDNNIKQTRAAIIIGKIEVEIITAITQRVGGVRSRGWKYTISKFGPREKMF